jgi:hypothetical protein
MRLSLSQLSIILRVFQKPSCFSVPSRNTIACEALPANRSYTRRTLFAPGVDISSDFLLSHGHDRYCALLGARSADSLTCFNDNSSLPAFGAALASLSLPAAPGFIQHW